MLYIYTDPKLSGMPNVVPWHFCTIDLRGKPSWALRSVSSGCEAVIHIRKRLIKLLIESPIPKDPTNSAELFELDMTFSLSGSASYRGFMLGCPIEAKEVDIFLGLVRRGSPLPRGFYEKFTSVFCWGMEDSHMDVLHQLSYRKIKGTQE